MVWYWYGIGVYGVYVMMGTNVGMAWHGSCQVYIGMVWASHALGTAKSAGWWCQCDGVVALMLEVALKSASPRLVLTRPVPRSAVQVDRLQRYGEGVRLGRVG